VPRLHRGKDVKRAVREKACAAGRSSKELNYWIHLDGEKVLRVTLPKSDDELRVGTQGSIRNQLRLAPTEFDELVRCPMTGPDYLNLLRSKRASGLL
jgi:hypothetical protein